MKLAILSDTHNLLRPQVLACLDQADVILHAGDLSSPVIVDRLRQDKPARIVRGNNDKEWAEDLPHDLTFSYEGVTFYMVHKKRDVPPALPGVQVIIFGHSHTYCQEVKDGVLWLNPGSCGPRRFHQDITMAMMDVQDGAYTVEKILIPHESK